MDPILAHMADSGLCTCGHPKGHHDSHWPEKAWRQCVHSGCPCTTYRPTFREVNLLTQEDRLQYAALADEADYRAHPAAWAPLAPPTTGA